MARGDGERNGEDISVTICATLSEAMAEGALRPGMKLLDDVIARHFGVSRTVARGAVAILEREHLVERRRNHGAFVATPGKDEAQQLLEARRCVELAIAERAILHASDADLDRLDGITHDEEAIHEGSDPAAKRRMSGNFHLELARVAGSGVLTEILQNLIARLSLAAALYEREQVQKCGAEDHRKILKALRDRDVDATRSAMLEHLHGMEAMMDFSAPLDDQNSLAMVLEKFSPAVRVAG